MAGNVWEWTSVTMEESGVSQIISVDFRKKTAETQQRAESALPAGMRVPQAETPKAEGSSPVGNAPSIESATTS